MQFHGDVCSDNFGTKINGFLKDVEKVSYNSKWNDLMKKLVNRLKEWGEEDMILVDNLKKEFKKFLYKFDEDVKEKIIKAINKKHIEKCIIEMNFYNFTSNEIPKDLIEILNMGKKFVIPEKLSEEEVKCRVNNELLDYLVKYRKYVQRGEINYKFENKEINVNSFLEVVMSECEKNNNIDNHYEFYKNVKEILMKIQWQLNKDSQAVFRGLHKKQVEQLVNIKDTIWNELDKDYGLMLVDCNVMRNAEISMMYSLNAEKIDINEENLQKVIEEKIKKFEKSLNNEESICLQARLKGSKTDEFMVPFLKLNGKIHKMNVEEIKNKDVKALKFRPVVDSTRWPLRRYSYIILNIAREIIYDLKKEFSYLDAITVKNSFEYVKGLKQMQLEENCYNITIGADLKDAYSNININDVMKALARIGKVIEIKEEIKQLFCQLLELVLKNGYIECSNGIYKVGHHLAMGDPSSGELLEIVGLASELTRFSGINKNISEMTPMPEGFENDVRNENEITKSIKKYARYVDDTLALVSGSEKREIVNAIMAIATMFPCHMKIEIELRLFSATFLDLFIVQKTFDCSYNVFVKRKMDNPISIIHKKSEVPIKMKSSVVKSELLRYRRLCSDDKIVRLNEQCLSRELKKVGYSEKGVQNMIRDAQKNIKENFDKIFEKRTKDSNKKRKIVYGSKVTFEGLIRSHSIVIEIIRASLVEQVMGPSVIPAMKLKGILITRKKYLQKMRKT